MNALQIVAMTFLMLGVIALLVELSCLFEKLKPPEWLMKASFYSMLLFISLSFVFTTVAVMTELPHRYPKTDYTLKYEITTVDGERADTVYVLTNK